ncbi:MAG: ester cyclase, partial [Chlorobi bacterium]|nr:ester cyclase [Chlorobiota bacterium]
NNAAAARWTITATNTGSGSHPPTGKRIEVPGISIIHFADGKIKDEWIASNNFYWLKQLGFTLVPPSFEGE